MARTDLDHRTLDSTILDASDEYLDGTQCVSFWTGSAQSIYIFYIEANGDVGYIKSADGGISFGAFQVIDATDDYHSVAVWFDRWTPGDTTGNTIHIAATNDTDDSIIYFSLGVDDDAAETNNNVLVFNPTTITAPAGVRSIAKGGDGDIYICSVATTTAGLYLHKSTDAGAAWSDISDDGGGNDLTTEYPGSDARGLVLPLLTDDDMMIMATELAGNHPEAWLMDGTNDTFTITDLMGAGNLGWNEMSGTLDKTTGDLWIFGGDDQKHIHMVRYDASTNLWDGKMILSGSEGNSIAVNQSRPGVCRDQTNGVLMLTIFVGTSLALYAPHHLFSSDDGKNWSQEVVSRNSMGLDDFRFCYTPAVMVDTNENWVTVIYDDDSEDIFLLTPQASVAAGATSGCLPYRTVSGVVKNDAGTAVSGAEVKVFANGIEPLVGSIGDKYKYQGTALTDGSGNYKCHVTDLSQRKTRFFAVASEKASWHPQFRSDFSNRGRFVNAQTNVKINTSTKVIDWDAIIVLKGYENLDCEKEFNTGTTYDPFMMMARFKLDIDNLTQGSNTTANAFFMGFGSNTAEPAGLNTDHFGLRLRVKNDVLVYETTGDAATNALTDTAINTFTHALAAETVYVQIVRKSPTDWTVGLYSDAQFSSLIEEESMTNLSTSVNDTFQFTIGNDNSGANDHVLDGTIDWIEIDWWTTGQIFDITRYDDTDPSTDAVDASLDIDID